MIKSGKVDTNGHVIYTITRDELTLLSLAAPKIIFDDKGDTPNAYEIGLIYHYGDANEIFLRADGIGNDRWIQLVIKDD